MPKMKISQNNLRRHYVPVELFEKIAFHLPVKSLLRFSTVSRSWKSTILAPGFAKRYRGGEMIVLTTDDDQSLVCPLSFLSSHNPTYNAEPFPRPSAAAADNSYVLASCGELWCVEIEKNLYLYNPSTRTRRRLPNPYFMENPNTYTMRTSFVYGLGYDAVGDDYKLLRLDHLRLDRRVVDVDRRVVDVDEVYSLGSNCWREVSCRKIWLSIPTPAASHLNIVQKGVFVGGALHWLIHQSWADGGRRRAILSFDVSTEEFVVEPLPLPLPAEIRQSDVIVLRGRGREMLGVCYHCGHRFVVWVMKEAGSWSKELDLSYAHIHPLCFSYYLRPLFFYDHSAQNQNLIMAFTSSTDIRKIFIYKSKPQDDASPPEPPLLLEKSFGCGLLDHFTYLESFVKL